MRGLKRGKLAQASMEYVMMAGFIALVILPTTFLFYRYASDSAQEIDQAQIDKFGRDIISTAETVYYLGPPSRIVLEERLPKNVESISIDQDTLTGTYLFAIAVRTKSGVANVTFPTQVPIWGMYGAEDMSEGVKKVRLEAREGAMGRPFIAISFDRSLIRVFVTAASYDGNFGGLAEGDQICQNSANAAGLDSTWTAWLSTSAVNAKSRISDGRYVLLNNTVVAHGLADLIDGSLTNAIPMDENRNVVSGTPVLTGTTETGELASDNCNEWTGGGNVQVGSTTAKNGGWTASSTIACGIYKLYCFENS